ncbi:MAG: signal peptidase I [Deinococcota bacterium]
MHSSRQLTSTQQAQPSPTHKTWVGLELIVATLLLTAFVASTVHISGRSMEPTLHHGDYALVIKLDAWLNKLGWHTLKRGDIIYFDAPNHPHTRGSTSRGRAWLPLLGSEPLYIKRLIALPGERVRIDRDQVFVDDVVLDEPYIQGLSDYTMTELTVPEGHYFVLGDNRVPLGSTDSRHFGVIPAADVYGRATLVLFPFRRGGQVNLKLLSNE